MGIRFAAKSIDIKVNKPGLFKFTLPPNIPELEIGKEYCWTVSLVRNRKRPSRNFYAYTEIKRVALPNELKQKLSTTTSKFEQSALYTNSGIWYDALIAIHCISNQGKAVQLQPVLEQINSGESMWLINQLPIASFVSDPFGAVTARGSSCS